METLHSESVVGDSEEKSEKELVAETIAYQNQYIK